MDGIINSLALSPNGRSIAVEVTRTGNRTIWVNRLPGRAIVWRITFGDTAYFRPSWTADGDDMLLSAIEATEAEWRSARRGRCCR